MGLVLPLLALAGTAAGTGLSMAGNAQDTRAENNTVADELKRQQGFQQKGSQIYNQNVNKNLGAENAQTQMGQGSGAASALYSALQGAQNGANGTGVTALSPQTSAVVQGKTGQSNDASAALQGYNQWQTQQGIGNTLTNSGLGINNQQSANDASTLPALLQGASHTGDSLTGLGSIASTLGMLAGLGGGLGGLGATALGAGKGLIDPGVGTNIAQGYMSPAQLQGLNPFASQAMGGANNFNVFGGQ